jgi:CD36 family
MLAWFINPPIDPIIKVYVFNYTNIDEFLDGTNGKIKLQEIGPYIYREPSQKVLFTFNEDLITYHVSRFKFLSNSIDLIFTAHCINIILSSLVNDDILGFSICLNCSSFLVFTQKYKMTRKKIESMSVKMTGLMQLVTIYTLVSLS